MSAPKDDGLKADEEAPAYPREISFHAPHHQTTGFNEDDNTIPSELSTLIAPSTLTPVYNPELHGDCHPSGISSHGSSGKSRKAFQLAALLGVLAIGALFGADVVSIVASSGSPDDVSHVSSAMSRDAMDLRANTRSGTEPAESDAANSAQGVKVSKKTKAKKAKAAKKQNDGADASGDNEDSAEEQKNSIDDVVGEEDDDEFTQMETQGGLELITPDMIANNNGSRGAVAIPEAQKRCPYVIETFKQQNEGVTNMDFLHKKYNAQSADPNVFYRATALLFWKDFGSGHWGREQNKSINFDDLVLLEEAKYEDGTPMSPMSTWTWTTGDQHLSNFGAWRNRGGEVVFSVNDFDEAAIYDFHIDILRIAVSICSHGFTNGLDEDQVKEALEAFTYTYVKTAIDYVGGDTSLVYELNPHTSTGALRDFLWDVENTQSISKQMHKFTEVESDGVRRFVRNADTRLEDVPPEIEEKIRAEITSTRYGASMMKMGWKVRGWDDDFFTVLDVARRVGSGIGSFGVDRFYVLLKGEDMLLSEGQDGASVILDVKYEPVSAVSRILDDVDPITQAWYQGMFRNEADRSAQGQRRLTSYTDPYVGYLVIEGNSYNVRQRSPYKHSFDYGTLKNARAFNEFMEQIAIATATAHVRGTVAKSPGQFKHVIKLLLAGDRNRRRWSELVAQIALSYRSQVLVDFECFKDYVKTNFPSNE
ncbi:hypothetical protein ACHAXR_006862 [Thalassiosira sp. AJA248-18]